MIDNNIERRLVIKFTTLEENQEKAIVNELISLMYYYYLKTGVSKNPGSNEVFEYYNRNIKKPESIQNMLNNFNVQVDAINYIEETYNMVILIVNGSEDYRQKHFIDDTRLYERAYYLEAMIYLLDKYNENEKVRNIIDYLNKHRINENNISDDHINRIVNKVYESV